MRIVLNEQCIHLIFIFFCQFIELMYTDIGQVEHKMSKLENTESKEMFLFSEIERVPDMIWTLSQLEINSNVLDEIPIKYAYMFILKAK